MNWYAAMPTGVFVEANGRTITACRRRRINQIHCCARRRRWPIAVRLKGGDPFIFGSRRRAETLCDAGISVLRGTGHYGGIRLLNPTLAFH